MGGGCGRPGVVRPLPSADVATLILLRHARSAANGSGILAGRSGGIGLDEIGARQVRDLGGRMSRIPLSALVSSPLQRCQDTVAELAGAQGLTVTSDERVSEVDYGAWTGRKVEDLAEEPLWKVVQQHPSAAVFPDGEGLAQMQARAVAAVRAHDARVTSEYGANAVWALCSHGDVIKAVLADALGLHLDGFQRIVVEPCSISAVRYTDTRPFVLGINDTGSDVSRLVPSADDGGAGSEAVVGGSTGR